MRVRVRVSLFGASDAPMCYIYYNQEIGAYIGWICKVKAIYLFFVQGNVTRTKGI